MGKPKPQPKPQPGNRALGRKPPPGLDYYVDSRGHVIPKPQGQEEDIGLVKSLLDWLELR